ncbi:hypothetical protein M426DRAFT_324601 [Hypoxylon sp. CI-4A]|nr:hypothetical protein M426DRAFT_324601 [Hypoxylon sp. CI-4A]
MATTVSIATRDPVISGYQSNGQNGALTSTDLDEIREYQKVISFRDTVISGKHPRIKVAKPVTPQQSITTPTGRVASSSSSHPLQNAPNLNAFQVDNLHSFKANAQQPAVAVHATASTSSIAAIPAVSGLIDSGKPDTHPVLLKKLEHLTNAEFQLRRRIFEDRLKEQFEQHQASQATEQLIDLDLSDIYAKALTLVQATAPPVDVPNPTTASNSSDSFDNNTFYSSPHETPDTRASPRAQISARQDVQMRDVPTSTPQRAAYVPQGAPSIPLPIQVLTPSYQPDMSRSVYPTQTASSSRQLQSSISGPRLSVQDHAPKSGREGETLTQARQARHVDAQVISSDSGAASRSDNSGYTDSDQPADKNRVQNRHQLLPPVQFRQQQTPLVRAHDLSPYAPQPAHVSPLAIARHPPMPESEVSILPGAPAQVTALRQEHGVITSPESSPQGEKGGKKKKQKKNKRKAETKAPDAPASPYIKPEPRSPSPLSAPHFARPQKRIRSSARHEPDLVYNEPQIERPISVLHREPYASTRLPNEQPTYSLERLDDPYAMPTRQSVAPTGQRLDRAIYEERRPDGTAVQYIQRVQSPYGFPAPYGAAEPRPLRSASYSVNPQYREVSYQRDGRVSVRPYGDRARSRSPVIVERRSPVMAPPGPPPRILIDQYGREYIDPPRASTIARSSAVPTPRPSEREIIYGRMPAPASSRVAGESFEENGVIYRRASPVYAPRRVITQPEYGIDYRSYRERDYSLQPMAAPAPDFVPVRGATVARDTNEIPQGYFSSRAMSVRPSGAIPYYDRTDAAPTGVPPRQYAASVHPEVRRDAVPPVLREYSVRPAERDAPRREYSVRPVEQRYYDRQPPTDEEVTYIEAPPRATQQGVIYADSSRRPAYQ